MHEQMTESEKGIGQEAVIDMKDIIEGLGSKEKELEEMERDLLDFEKG